MMVDVFRRPEDGGDRFLREGWYLPTKALTVSHTGGPQVRRTLRVSSGLQDCFTAERIGLFQKADLSLYMPP
jgi:hypothetical protein